MTDHFHSPEAETYLRWRLSFEQIQLEFVSNRRQRGDWQSGFRRKEDIDEGLIKHQIQFEMEEAMWNWLDTCP
jgi:hypothetical protein